MIQGLTSFRERFKDYQQQYIIIGGVACYLLMDEYGSEFRSTKDLDVVLLVESLTSDFGAALWEYVKEGEYQFSNKSTGHPCFYRFSSPKNDSYPAMIELFSRKQDAIVLPEDARITPLPIDEEVSSLSAILLDEEYYNLLKEEPIVINNLPLLNEQRLILFKAKAWLDLTKRRENGESVDSKNIKKHKNDVFRLSSLLVAGQQIMVTEQIKNDLEQFLKAMETEEIDLKQFGLGEQSKSDVLQRIRNAYVIKN